MGNGAGLKALQVVANAERVARDRAARRRAGGRVPRAARAGRRRARRARLRADAVRAGAGGSSALGRHRARRGVDPRRQPARRGRRRRSGDGRSERPAASRAAVSRHRAPLRDALASLIVLVAALSGGGLAKARDHRGGVLRRRDGLELVPPASAGATAAGSRPGAARRQRAPVSDALVEQLVGDLGAIRAPRGTRLHARSWQTEAPLRMLLNNLDPEVAEHPESLVVYGGSGRAARSHDALRAIVRTLLRLRDDETLLVQSGKPVGVFRTHEGAPRVLIANSLLVPAWATWDEFRRLEAAGSDDVRSDDGRVVDLHRHAGDPPGDVPDVLCRGRDAFRLARSRRPDGPHVGPRRDGRRAAARGDDGRRGDPLRRGRPAVDRSAARDRAMSTSRRTTLDDALARVRTAAAERRPLSVGLRANAADVLPELVARGEAFDLVTDQTAAHDPLTGYVPAEVPVRGGGRASRTRSGASTCGSPRSRSSRTSARWSSSSGWGATFSTMATTCEVRPIERV